MFNNPQIIDLPKHSDISFKPLADKALLHTQLSSLMFYIPLIGALAAACYVNETFANNAQVYLLIGMPILVLVSLLYNVINVRMRGFAVRNHDIVFKKGVIWQQVTILPLARVQHMEIHQGPIERKLSLASIKLFSAGGVSADLKISGLTHDDCKNMRQFVQRYRQDDTTPQAALADE